ncbi:MAG: N-acyl-D-amino-acid deacylase family protein [Gemmataceae bacterium]
MTSYAFLLLTLLPAAEPVQADIVLRNGTLHDGSGQPGQVGDIAIQGDRIVAVGKFDVAGDPTILDVKGLIVAPGFIDLHTHSDNAIVLPTTKSNLNYLMQGVTTIVTGNCGFGPTDVAKYYQTMERNGVGSNVVHQMPHNALRQRVMGNANRMPTKKELAEMEKLVDQGMRDGAWGLSTGLIYNPGTYATTEEIIALARVAARHGGFYASHIRDENTGLLSAVDEAIRIGREAQLPVHISHMKASGPQVWGKSGDAVALVLQARKQGQIVTADQYPYIASSTRLSAMLVPAQFREGSREELIARMDDAEEGPRVREGIRQKLDVRNGAKSIRIAGYAKNTSWQGKDLENIAAAVKKDVVDVVMDIIRNGDAQVVCFNMHEEDVRLIMKQPFVATASDGSAMTPANNFPHPRSYGTFPRKIGRYAIEEKIIPLEQAIRSASGLPADILRLPERGYLKPGYFADIVVLDPTTYRDTATFDKPHQYATGMQYLFVNGKLTIQNGKYTSALAGRVLRHQSTR